MNTTSIAPNLDVLPAEGILGPERLQQIRKLLGPSPTLVVTSALNKSISQPLRDAEVPGDLSSTNQPLIVGAKCGVEAGNLVVVGFKTKEAVVSFLGSNARLTSAPVTGWNGYFLIWFRTDFLPADQELDSMFWCSTGVIPLAWADESDKVVAQVVQAGSPPAVRFNELTWPEPESGVFRFQYLRSIYGQPYLATKRKRTLNLSFWSGWLIDRLGLVFDTRLDAFRRLREPDSKSETLGMGAATELVTGALQQSAQADQRNFPVAEIRPRRIQELLRLMQTMAAIRPASEVEGVEGYFSMGIVERHGASITSEALWADWIALVSETPSTPGHKQDELTPAPNTDTHSTTSSRCKNPAL